jgi:hypothetical protein
VKDLTRVAILELIPHLLPTGGGDSALPFASSHNFPPFLKAHMWLIPAGLALAAFVIAAAKPVRVPTSGALPRPVNVVVWGAVGVGCLILMAYFVHRSGW